MVEWLIDMQINLQLKDEIIYMAINLADRYLLISKIDQFQFILIILTSLHIAAKYDKSHGIKMSTLIAASGNCFRGSEINRTELKMLQVFDFDISIPIDRKSVV